MDIYCENGIGLENCVCFIFHKKKKLLYAIYDAALARSSYQCRQTFIAYTSSHSLTEKHITLNIIKIKVNFLVPSDEAVAADEAALVHMHTLTNIDTIKAHHFRSDAYAFILFMSVCVCVLVVAGNTSIP